MARPGSLLASDNCCRTIVYNGVGQKTVGSQRPAATGSKHVFCTRLLFKAHPGGWKGDPLQSQVGLGPLLPPPNRLFGGIPQKISGALQPESIPRPMARGGGFASPPRGTKLKTSSSKLKTSLPCTTAEVRTCAKD